MSPSRKLQDCPSDQTNLSSLFMRRYKYAGRDIFRPIWFYISLNKNGYTAMKRLITSHGGKVSAELGDKKTSKEICLVDPQAKASRDGRPAYSVDYIQSCITAQRLLNVEDFRILPVGSTRRTPAKQHRTVPDREQLVDNGGRQINGCGTPELAQTKDSEVTDDLPCLEQGQNDDGTNQALVTNDQVATDVLPEETPLQEAGEADRGILSRKDRSEKFQNTQAKPPSKRPDIVTPKKRRSRDWIAKAGGKDGRDELEVLGIPQTVTPSKDTVNWSKKEDDDITQLCVDVKKLYHDTNRDPNKIFTLACWVGIENAKLLPPGRSAKACLERAKELWKNGGTKTAGTAEKVDRDGRDVKRARLSPARTGNSEDKEEIAESRDQPQRPLSPEASPARQEADQAEPEILKNASRHETREYIFELVTRIAKHGKVTKRRAFRALRDERGHWKRALRLIMRRKGTGDA